jgi:thiamine biosynthesis protein ThiS
MEVVVNGTLRGLTEGATVSDLVHELGFGDKQVVVELNGEPVERSRFGETALRAGDRIEVVRAVAGG